MAPRYRPRQFYSTDELGQGPSAAQPSPLGSQFLFTCHSQPVPKAPHCHHVCHKVFLLSLCYHAHFISPRFLWVSPYPFFSFSPCQVCRAFPGLASSSPNFTSCHLPTYPTLQLKRTALLNGCPPLPLSLGLCPYFSLSGKARFLCP